MFLYQCLCSTYFVVKWSSRRRIEWLKIDLLDMVIKLNEQITRIIIKRVSYIECESFGPQKIL